MKKVNKPVKAYKGFNKHMQCAPNRKIFQYEIGKEYKEDEANLCHCGFHACENPLDVLSYYNNIDDKFCEVELDKIDPNRNKDSKICGKKIKIGIEIGFLGLFKAGIEWIKNKTIFTKEDFKKLPSGHNAKIGSSDYNAKIGSSSGGAKIGSSGDHAQISSSGDRARIGSSGNDAKIGSSGDGAKIGSSGNDAKIGSSGDFAQIGSSGDFAQIGSSGNDAKIGSSGDAKIGSSGNRAQIGSSGYNAKIGSSGDDAKISSSGNDCVIMCAGINSSAKAKIGSWITLAEWKYSEEKQKYILFSVVTKQVDGIEIKEDVYYTLQDGKFKESGQQ